MATGPIFFFFFLISFFFCADLRQPVIGGECRRLSVCWFFFYFFFFARAVEAASVDVSVANGIAPGGISARYASLHNERRQEKT